MAETRVSYNRGLLFQIYRDTYVTQLNKAMAESVIQHCKDIFSRHSIPEELVMNNGLQFDYNAFYKFSEQYQFCHVTSSQYYPKSNVEAE